MKYLIVLILLMASCTLSPSFHTHNHTHKETYLVRPDSIERVLTGDKEDV